MKKYGIVAAGVLGLAVLSGGVAMAQQENYAFSRPTLADVASKAHSPLTVANGSSYAHVFPTRERAQGLAATATTAPLTYHGGPIMANVTAYVIFWAPSTLQDGTAASMPAAFQNLQTQFFQDYSGHSLAVNNTQYYQTINNVTNYIKSPVVLGGTFVDTTPYPAISCTYALVKKNCVTDANIQAEVQRIIVAKGWQTGLNSLFFIYTAQGESECSSAGSNSCTYSTFCGWHSYVPGASPIIYAYIAYAGVSSCQSQTSPNANVAADSTASIASHELAEAITDPLLNGWYNSAGWENGDLCAWNYGTNTWGSASPKNANESWNGHLYELQQEWNNHTNSCVQVGP